MPNISWSYLAGFFDGEGTILAKRDGSISFDISIPQAEETIIRSISQFLRNQGIHNGVYTYDPGKYPSKFKNGHIGKRQWTVRLNHRKSVELFISNILPYVIVKRVKIQDAWRFLKLFPPIWGLIAREKLRERAIKQAAMTHCKHGHSLRDAYHYPTATGVSRRCRICSKHAGRRAYLKRATGTLRAKY